jgi:hypothetical protein
MINFENQLQSMNRENNFLIKMKIILRLQDDFIFFMDWNDLNAIFFYYYVCEKRTNLEVILDVIFNEVHCGRCALDVLEENFEINRIQVDVIVLYVKVMK